jgi:hypothetical protein
MPLQPPKRTAAGYFLALQPPVQTPAIRWTTAGTWDLSGDVGGAWRTWADGQRNTLLGELLSHGTWFSRAPRRDVLEPLFSPWVSVSATLTCRGPAIPGSGSGADESSGSAVWQLDGLLMTGTSIDPVWSVASATPDESLDRISLFGGDSDDGASSVGGGLREIQLDEIEDAPASPPAKIRSREWEARKFLAKERVREARLKAQIARHLAAKEEERYYRLFGELDDGESHFSDYDLSDAESDGEGDDTSESGAENHV